MIDARVGFNVECRGSPSILKANSNLNSNSNLTNLNLSDGGGKAPRQSRQVASGRVTPDHMEHISSVGPSAGPRYLVLFPGHCSPVSLSASSSQPPFLPMELFAMSAVVGKLDGARHVTEAIRSPTADGGVRFTHPPLHLALETLRPKYKHTRHG